MTRTIGFGKGQEYKSTIIHVDGTYDSREQIGFRKESGFSTLEKIGFVDANGNPLRKPTLKQKIGFI